MPDMRDLINRFYPVVLVVMVVSLSADVLSSIDEVTRPIIGLGEEVVVQTQLENMFPGMTEFTMEDDVYIVMADDVIIGYAFLARGFGAQGEITILVALENEPTVKGIFIVSQRETPGVGDIIVEPAFTDQFAGMKIEDIRLTAEKGQIDAITGATVSAKAVVDIVRNTALEKVKELFGSD